jgi:hypothetical protein
MSAMAWLEIAHWGQPLELHNLDAAVANGFETWLPLPERQVTFGRKPPRDAMSSRLCLPRVASLSKRHGAILPAAAGAFDVVDLLSSGGTFINGKRLIQGEPPRRLQSGDIIALGAPVSGPYARFHGTELALAIYDTQEADLLAAIRDRLPGSEDVYGDWLEQGGQLEQAEFLRTKQPRDVESFRRRHALIKTIDAAPVGAGWRMRLTAARGHIR